MKHLSIFDGILRRCFRVKSSFSLCRIVITTLFTSQQKARGNWSCQCLRRNKFNLFSSYFKFFYCHLFWQRDYVWNPNAIMLFELNVSAAAFIEMLLLTKRFNESYLLCHEIFISLCQRSLQIKSSNLMRLFMPLSSLEFSCRVSAHETWRALSNIMTAFTHSSCVICLTSLEFFFSSQDFHRRFVYILHQLNDHK